MYRTVSEEMTPTPTLEQGSISSTNQAAPDNGCALVLDSICYIDTFTNGVIANGDYVYNDMSGTNPIIGNNQYYRISLINTYTVLIDAGGGITEVSICP